MFPDVTSQDITALWDHRMQQLANQLANGEIEIGDWQIEMRQEIRDAFAMQVRAGAGGDATMDDYLKLGAQVRSQDGYLEDFAHAIADGDVSPDAIASRAAMYAKSSGQMYWRTIAPNMPTYPGEQQCLGNCGCEWRDNGDGSFSWIRSKDDSCPDCKHNEEIYQEYVPN